MKKNTTTSTREMLPLNHRNVLFTFNAARDREWQHTFIKRPNFFLPATTLIIQISLTGVLERYLIDTLDRKIKEHYERNPRLWPKTLRLDGRILFR